MAITRHRGRGCAKTNTAAFSSCKAGPRPPTFAAGGKPGLIFDSRDIVNVVAIEDSDTIADLLVQADAALRTSLTPGETW